jgi:hypothetical protein
MPDSYPNCGAELAQADICPNCGADLHASAPALNAVPDGGQQLPEVQLLTCYPALDFAIGLVATLVTTALLCSSLILVLYVVSNMPRYKALKRGMVATGVPLASMALGLLSICFYSEFHAH